MPPCDVAAPELFIFVINFMNSCIESPWTIPSSVVLRHALYFSSLLSYVWLNLYLDHKMCATHSKLDFCFFLNHCSFIFHLKTKKSLINALSITVLSSLLLAKVSAMPSIE